MQDNFYKTNFIFEYLTHPEKHSLNAISEFVINAAGLACLKEPHSGKYLLANHFVESSSGMKAEDLVGLTVEDLPVQCPKDQEKSFSEMIKEIDQKVAIHQCPILHQEISITYEGLIDINSKIKMPILNQQAKSVAILTYSENLTPRTNLFTLLKHYQKYYAPNTKAAIQKFLTYLNIYNDFHSEEIPTLCEVYILIVMCQDAHLKQATALLNKTDVKHNKVSSSTVSSQIHALKRKIKSNTSLNTLLGKIRNAEHRYTL